MVLKPRWLMLLALLGGITPWTTTSASLNIEFKEPQWTFLLQNEPLGKTEAQLKPDERKFASQIQPLLSQKKYEKVREIFANRPIENDSAALQQLRGQILLNLKRYKEAEQALLAALRTVPDLTLSHRSLSLLYMTQKNYGNARKHLRRSIELGAVDAQLYGQLAYVNLKSDFPASAVAGYQQALFLEPENQQWRQGLVYALLRSQALDQAQAMVTEMLTESENSVSLWLMRSQIALSRNRYQEALSSLEIALLLGDKQPQNYSIAAKLHLEHGSVRRAVDLLIASQPTKISDQNELIDTIENAASLLAYRQQWPELSRVLAASNKLKTLSATSKARFNVYRAQLTMEKGQLQQARKALKTAVNLDPTNGEALLSLGDLYARQQQPEQALTMYSRAAALTEYRERALLNHAQMEIDRQSYSEALRLLRQAAKLNPGRNDIVTNIRALENLIRNQG